MHTIDVHKPLCTLSVMRLHGRPPTDSVEGKSQGRDDQICTWKGVRVKAIGWITANALKCRRLGLGYCQLDLNS
jgi:hypothetical protein